MPAGEGSRDRGACNIIQINRAGQSSRKELTAKWKNPKHSRCLCVVCANERAVGPIPKFRLLASEKFGRKKVAKKVSTEAYKMLTFPAH
jgi:hypothetical protein